MRTIFDYPFESQGLRSRISQMFDKDSGRTVLLAVDHGYFQGAPEGLKDLKSTIKPLLEYCDAISPCIGGLKYVSKWSTTPIILRATGGNSMTRESELDDEAITVSVERILASNAIGYTASCYVGMPHQKQTIKNLTDLINEGDKYNLISIGITAVGKGLGKDLKYLEHASRVLSENGADIVKTYYCDSFEKLIDSCLSPVVIAGGTKIGTQEALDLTYNAIHAGAVGVDMGRNIFQNQNSVAMIKAVRAIVHEEETAVKAYQLYQELGGKE
jgi:3-hydroxy-5-phosphonooxypentane-2,4-dione thiolase